MVTIDSTTLSVRRFELGDFTDIFSLCIDDNYVYISTPFAYDKIVFQWFDLGLNNEKRFEYTNKEVILFHIAMQAIGDYIYVLTGMSGFESKPNNYVENHLLKFDKNFVLLQDIDLQFNNGGYVGMAYDGDKKLYITKASEGLANGEALPSNEPKVPANYT